LRAGNSTFQSRVDALEQRNKSLEIANQVLRDRVLATEQKEGDQEFQITVKQQQMDILRFLLTTRDDSKVAELVAEIERLNQIREELAGDLEKSEDQSRILDAVIEVRGAEGRAIYRQQQAQIVELRNEVAELCGSGLSMRDVNALREMLDNSRSETTSYANLNNQKDKTIKLLEKSLNGLRTFAVLIGTVSTLSFIAYLANNNKQRNSMLSEFSESQVKECIQKIIDKNGEDVNARYENGYIRFDFPKGKNRLEVSDCDPIPSFRITSLK
jgi:hypothetical protein